MGVPRPAGRGTGRCYSRVKVGKPEVCVGLGRALPALCNLWWKGMGRPGLLFPALLWVFLAALGELRLLVQPGVWEDALKISR